ncbi:FKBP-type peptidyl-prolyl cis-trans isomerase [Candidatus Sumerlaeota bacterium]|nr:FKBP-type peptidyl-prolyl cis-trans isomerase [Candidatus Sumerlaeota bacterium]
MKRVSIRMLLLFAGYMILLSCAERPQENAGIQNPQKPITSVMPSPTPEKTPPPTPVPLPTTDAYTTRTIALEDITKVPEFARTLVKNLTNKDESEQEWRLHPEGFMYHDIHVGTGKPITRGVAVHTLLRGYLANGVEFVNTMKNPYSPSFAFTFGYRDMLRGFEMGVATMREKGKRVIVLPPDLGYGEDEYRSENVNIPANSTLIFEASVMWIREAEWDKINTFKYK